MRDRPSIAGSSLLPARRKEGNPLCRRAVTNTCSSMTCRSPGEDRECGHRTARLPAFGVPDLPEGFSKRDRPALRLTPVLAAAPGHLWPGAGRRFDSEQLLLFEFRPIPVRRNFVLGSATLLPLIV